MTPFIRRECRSFRKTTDGFGGLSNMAGGYMLRVNGVLIKTTEALYQACRFPNMPEVQRLIIDERSPMATKMKSKSFRHQSRPDWDCVRVDLMRWCLKVKLLQSWTRFGGLLRETGECPIVEESRKDKFWGAVPSKDNPNILVGDNVLGSLLGEMRNLANGEQLTRVEPLGTSDFLLLGAPIETVSKSAGNGVV